jgi:hypothetical protein
MPRLYTPTPKPPNETKEQTFQRIKGDIDRFTEDASPEGIHSMVNIFPGIMKELNPQGPLPNRTPLPIDKIQEKKPEIDKAIQDYKDAEPSKKDPFSLMNRLYEWSTEQA